MLSLTKKKQEKNQSIKSK